jgi:hypothetical protein
MLLAGIMQLKRKLNRSNGWEKGVQRKGAKTQGRKGPPKKDGDF